MGRKRNHDWDYWYQIFLAADVPLKQFCREHGLPYDSTVRAFRTKNGAKMEEKTGGTSEYCERLISDKEELAEYLLRCLADLLKAREAAVKIVNRILDTAEDIVDEGGAQGAMMALKNFLVIDRDVRMALIAAQNKTETAELIQKCLDGEMDAIEAALRFELLGVEMPEALKILLQRTPAPEPVEANDGVPDDVLETEFQKAMQDIDRQENEWLDKRRAEVGDMKQKFTAEKNERT